jgi:hypothetical protein
MPLLAPERSDMANECTSVTKTFGLAEECKLASSMQLDEPSDKKPAEQL